jgi:hypothetical protein
MTARASLAIALVLAACSGGGGTTVGGPPDAGPYMYRTCDPAARIGEFKVQLEASFTAVHGVVAAGVVPGDVPELVTQEGDCRVVRRRNLFCNPACDGSSTCAEGGRCIPEPASLNAGTVSIRGLSAPVTMTPGQIGHHYDFTTLPHPGFQTGAPVLLWASGAEVAPFVLQGQGVAALALAGDKLVLEPGKPFELKWTPGPPGPARIGLQIEIDQHGLSHASLQCDVADQGATTIPASLIDALVAQGTSGYPKVTATRRTADAAMLAGGCVELLVLNAIERPLVVPGHDPCHTDGDCPAGKTCALAIQTCR